MNSKGSYSVCSDGLCPVCRYKITSKPVSCVGCETRYHEECWLYVWGECSIFGCKKNLWKKIERSSPIAATPPISMFDSNPRAHMGFFGYHFFVMSVVCVLMCMCLLLSTSTEVRPGQIVVSEYPFGYCDVQRSYQRYWPVFSTCYRKSGVIRFSDHIIFRGDMHAIVQVEVEYGLPYETEQILSLHKDYGSEKCLEENIKHYVESVVRCSAVNVASLDALRLELSPLKRDALISLSVKVTDFYECSRGAEGRGY
ncbi:MAG: hypothetical protein Q7S19_01005 [bacterium]|nr:hypothetical protein [bacterium]